jgi:Xaa-Pro aminopeptidase
MSQYGFDAILIGDEKNYRYFTGDRSPTKNRPAFVIVPLKGKPILLASEFGAKTAKFIAHISDVRVYQMPVSYQAIADIIRSLGVKRVGIEYDDHIFGAFHSSMQWGEFDRMKYNLPTVEFSDASELLWELRLIKTEEEVNCIRRAADITSEAYRRTFAEATEGMTERKVAALLLSHMAFLGADIPFRGKPGPCSLIILDANHPAGNPPIPTDKALERGNILHIDGGAIYKGYCVDFTRLGVVGEPTQRQMREWKKVTGLVEENIQKLRPGNQFKALTCHFHGIGLDAIEPPFGGMVGKAVHGEWPIREGMVICVEQNNYLGTGEVFAYEDIAVVRKNGPEIISSADPKLQRIKTI